MGFAGYHPFLRDVRIFCPKASDALYVAVEFALFAVRHAAGGGRVCPAAEQPAGRGDVFDCRRHFHWFHGLFFVAGDLRFRHQRLYSAAACGVDAHSDCDDGERVGAVAP